MRRGEKRMLSECIDSSKHGVTRVSQSRHRLSHGKKRRVPSRSTLGQTMK